MRLTKRVAGTVLVTSVLLVLAGMLTAQEKNGPSARSDGTETVQVQSTPPAEAPKQPVLLDLSAYMPQWMRIPVFGSGIEIGQILVAFVLILAGFVVKKVSDFIFNEKILPLLARTKSDFDDMLAKAVSKPLGYLFLWGGLAAAVTVLPLPEEGELAGFVTGVLKVLVVADAVWFLFRLVDVLVAYLAALAAGTESRLDDQLIPLLRKALKLTIVVVCALTVLQLFGYPVSTIIATLGIGGLAVALAMQDTLGNFFGSVAIFLDRPFQVGDRVKIADVEGVVEEIGFRSTRLRTWPATLVSIPNKTVANETVDNLSRMPKRRVSQTVGLTYETTADEMEKMVKSIEGILREDAGVDQEFIIVRFDGFGDSSLDIQVIYFTRPVELAAHLEVKERVNLAIMRAVADQGLSIAFPTRTVYFEGEVAKRLADRDAGKEPSRKDS